MTENDTKLTTESGFKMEIDSLNTTSERPKMMDGQGQQQHEEDEGRYLLPFLIIIIGTIYM